MSRKYKSKFLPIIEAELKEVLIELSEVEDLLIEIEEFNKPLPERAIYLANESKTAVCRVQTRLEYIERLLAGSTDPNPFAALERKSTDLLTAIVRKSPPPKDNLS